MLRQPDNFDPDFIFHDCHWLLFARRRRAREQVEEGLVVDLQVGYFDVYSEVWQFRNLSEDLLDGAGNQTSILECLVRACHCERFPRSGLAVTYYGA